ncbi:hypothetical protein EVAR_40857_1 [Eumeta japonica]|uniref:Uncharacterized protein n=1 Tax=Eumeta variegata TaxID=151549 RepID=A0A4C1X8B0_EUMVA|nr:hypothetical protein EVAR_40857_1 [Eumeta japonica]
MLRITADKPKITHRNPVFFSYINMTSRRYSRADVSYIGLNFELLEPIGNNVSEKYEKRPTVHSMFSSTSESNGNGLRASYNISLLFAKSGKPQTIGEQLISPAIEKVECLDEDIQTYVQHLMALHDDFKFKFEDILSMEIPPWIINPFNETKVENVILQEELLELSTNGELKCVFVLYEYRDHTYRQTFAEIGFPLCDLLLKNKLFGKPLRQGWNTKLPNSTGCQPGWHVLTLSEDGGQTLVNFLKMKEFHDNNDKKAPVTRQYTDDIPVIKLGEVELTLSQLQISKASGADGNTTERCVEEVLDWKTHGINVNREYLSHLRFADDVVIRMTTSSAKQHSGHSITTTHHTAVETIIAD